jgi:hypothetical protein
MTKPNSCLNTEKLEADMCDTEVIIQDLHNISQRIEDMKDDESNPIIKLKLRSFITELGKEIEWNEQILQELEQSKDFLENRGNN